jgi:hypothetical protein
VSSTWEEEKISNRGEGRGGGRTDLSTLLVESIVNLSTPPGKQPKRSHAQRTKSPELTMQNLVSRASET